MDRFPGSSRADTLEVIHPSLLPPAYNTTINAAYQNITQQHEAGGLYPAPVSCTRADLHTSVLLTPASVQLVINGYSAALCRLVGTTLKTSHRHQDPGRVWRGELMLLLGALY